MVVNNTSGKYILSALLSLLGLLVSVLQLNAQSESFYVQASKTTVEATEQFQITFTLNANGSDFQAPPLKDFNVLMGPSTSKSVNFVNGNVSQSVSYTYVLQAKTDGSFKIGSATIKANGKIFQSAPITITVAKANTKAQAQGQDKQPQTEAELAAYLAKNLYIKAIPSKTNVYQGEAIYVTYKLFCKVSLVNFNLSKLPTLNGFWSQDLEMPKQLQLTKEVINGVEYHTAELKKTIVFPQYDGALTLDRRRACADRRHLAAARPVRGVRRPAARLHRRPALSGLRSEMQSGRGIGYGNPDGRSRKPEARKAARHREGNADRGD